jgi:hypothetical protein
MKIAMCNWCGEKMDLPAWFKHGEEAEVSWDQIQDLYESGINVMMLFSKGSRILAVDTKRFGQR